MRAEPKYSSRILLSSGLRLALAPSDTYQSLVDARNSGSWLMVLVRAAFYMVVFAAAVVMAATGHVTFGLMFHVGLSWSFLVIWQAIAGATIILPARGRRVRLARAFELLFLAYVPWALYGLAMTALAVLAEPDLPILVVVLTGVAPIAWTSVVVAGFCRTVLGVSTSGARRLTLVHQLVIWGGTMAFLWFAVGGWTPILQTVGL